MGIPRSHIDEIDNLPFCEIVTESVDVYKKYIDGIIIREYENNYTKACKLFKEAATSDPTCSLANYALFWSGFLSTDEALKKDGDKAINAAISHLYKLPPRFSFLIKYHNFWFNKGDMDKLVNSEYINSKDKVSDVLTNLISTIGENLTIKRCAYIENSEGFIGTYIHNVEKDNMGKIGVLLSVKTDIKFDLINDFLKKLCMHIAASNPISINISDVNEDLLKKEKEFQLEEIKKSGKDESIQEKMLEGKIKKFFSEVVFLEQSFVMDETIKIKNLIEKTSKDLNGTIEIKEFVRFKIGE